MLGIRRIEMLEAEVYITLKKTVADPQGLTIKHALESLGYAQDIKEVRMGKLVKIKLNLSDPQAAQEKLEQMCKKLLANPIIEEYRFSIKEGSV
ncbi:MAG: phosphoribosylformylglycinamidine synthase subunit PurS [Candidatus Omnitrophota bacterium]